MTAILGISAFYHDSAAALVVDGEVVAAAQEERFTRRKHDAGFPIQAIEFCLDHAGLAIEDLDHVAFYEKPFLKFERILETYLQYSPRGFRSFATAMPIWLKSKLYLSRLIARELGHRYRKRIVFVEHHESHAASAFFPSPFDEAAILTVDGVGEWATTTLGVGTANQIKSQQHLNFPDSLGLLYSAFTYFCGFRVNGGEGKLMGLAPSGEPEFVDMILEHLIDLKDDGSFRLNQSFFDYCVGATMTSLRFEKLFGGPRREPESEITQREKNLAASVQAVTETIMLKMAANLHSVTGMNNLCIAGGVGLNCVANGRLLRESPFENVWVQPAAGDSGGAIGAALFVWHQLLGKPRQARSSRTAYLGPTISTNEASVVFASHNAACREFETNAELFEVVATQIAAGKIVGWVQGRMEFGPRALGNRSILADPRAPTMQDQLNTKVKFRESFRPFAPVVLEERASDFFALDRPSPSMLFASTLQESAPAIPAVTHLDGSARVQTVSESDNPMLYELLKRFELQTGCPVLVNTSFNVRGEPIVANAEDAYRCLMKTDLDLLVVGKVLLEKSAQPPLADRDPIQPSISLPEKLMAIWLTLTFPIRWMVSKLILAAIYYLIVTPIGWWVRKLKRDSFGPVNSESRSYWQSRDESNVNHSSYFKQY